MTDFTQNICVQLFCALRKRSILIIWKLTQIFLSPNSFELGQRLFPEIVNHPKTSLGNNFELQQRAYWCVVCSRPWAVRQSMIVCRGWVSKRGKYLTGRLTNIVDKFWQILMRKAANVVKCQQILSQSFTWAGLGPSPLIEFKWPCGSSDLYERVSMERYSVWGVCTM